ncbi:MAG: type I restriction enzyme HsdR N-terminal domain-containing protein [Desulfobacterales bacterium]|nr:type I restriction enzyme HsdR N-terminal domain-containing protein [Desulfobacterales bacterium]
MFSGIKSELFDDPDFKEDSVREVVITPILSKLGYLLVGPSRVTRSKTLKHPYIRVGTRNHPVTTIPDYTLLHEEKPIFVLDAKGPKESVLKHEHIQQAYSYAIHPEVKCKEFGLCNGRQLAIFNVDQIEPILVLDFDEFESRWTEIEKHLSPKYLLKPELRRFSPDFGFKLNRLGVDKNTDLIIVGVRLNLFVKVDDNMITASANCDFGGVPHCVSFDFTPAMLDQMVAGLPEPLGDMFCEALNRAPFQAAAGLVIELDLTARLGEEIQVQHESFIPLLIQEIHESRFNPSLVPNDPNDIPLHVYQLRKAFKLRDIE